MKKRNYAFEDEKEYVFELNTGTFFPYSMSRVFFKLIIPDRALSLNSLVQKPR